MFKRKKQPVTLGQDPAGTTDYEANKYPASDLAAGIPVGVFPGYIGTDQHAIIETFPGAVSKRIDDSPITFARYNMSRGVHDVQLSNGWQYTNYGQIQNYRNEGYLAVVMPQIPGQSRLSGSSISSGFVPRGPAPAQWQANVNAVQQQPSNPGGPGQLLGPVAMGGARG
jgi:hypothetical protein